MTRRVIVIGGSDQGRQSIDVLETSSDHAVVGVLDDALPIGTEVAGSAVIGNTSDLSTCVEATDADGFLVAIGDNFARGAHFDAVRSACPSLEPVSAVHPGAVVARDAELGPGATLMPGAVVSNGSRVGAGALLGINSSIDHDGQLDDFVSFGPGARSGGFVTVGSYTAVGLGVSVIHRVTIGAHTVVGAGALVLSDLPDEVVAYGAPARVVRPRALGEGYL